MSTIHRNVNMRSRQKRRACEQYCAELLESRILLDGSTYQYHIISGSVNNGYSYSVNQTVSYVGRLVDASGNGISGFQIEADDSLLKESRIVGTTDSSGYFTFSDTATAAGLFAVTFQSNSTFVAPQSVVFAVSNPNVSVFATNGLNFLLGPSNGLLSDPITTAIVNKTGSLLQSTQAGFDDVVSGFQSTLTDFAVNFEQSFTSSVANKVAIAGLVTCIDPADGLCEIDVGFLADSIAMQAAQSAIDVAIQNSGISLSLQNTLISLVGATGTVVGFVQLNAKANPTILDFASTGEDIKNLALTIGDWVVHAPDISNVNTSSQTGHFNLLLTNPQDSNAIIMAVSRPAATDTTPPFAAPNFPAADSSVSQAALNNTHFLDVTYSDTGGSGLKSNSIAALAPQFTLSGSATAGVSIGTPSLLGGTSSTYQYPFTGSFGTGQVTVNFLAGTFSDNAGNKNRAATESFTVVGSPTISSVTPTTLFPETTTQSITISGTGFSSASTLTLTDTFGNAQRGIVPSFNSGFPNQLQYSLNVGTSLGQ